MGTSDDHIARLESEIRYLKGLLDENGIAYDYEAFVEVSKREEPVEIEFPELAAEHAIQFYSYFRGRKDVYVKRNAKKGYYTQCNNFWKTGVCPKKSGENVKCHDCPAKDYKELKISVMLEHLKGTKEDCSDVIGLYPLFPDGTCWFLVFDFDNHDEDAAPSKDWEQEVDALRKICQALGIDALVERSRSGRGAHVWIFFSEAIQATKVRRFGEALLAKGAESVSLRSFRYYDRMMPMQDSLPEGKLGNLIALPLQGQALRKGNSAFVDEFWRPYKDQWSKLLHTRKLSEAEVDAYVKSWCPEDNAMQMFQSDKVDEQEDSNLLLFGISPKPSTRYFKADDVTGTVKILLADGIYVDKRNLKPRLQNTIRRLAAYSNPQFFQNLALGFSTRASAAKYVYGMSATVKRGDKQERKLLMQLGPIRHRYTAKERAIKQGIGHYVYPRFTRMIDLSPSDDRHISELYRLIVDNELRNMQIVADAVDCVKKGRTPVVMTKYREHAETLYGLLQGVADHVFLLQGGKSLKARAELREKMAAVVRDESMIMVATGQYVGEGFNYPRLDTMLMAMPISFEGNVEQYAGRLNRDYEGKKDVIIFDYIDQHVPVLERMYHRRLRTYMKIGFEVCAEVVDKQKVNNSIFDSIGYWAVFEKDIYSAAKSIVISSPFLSSRKVEWFVDQSEALQKRNVTVKVFSLSPEAYPEEGREHHAELLGRLASAGIYVKTQNHCHERYAVIDQSLVWYGSMNLLSRGREDDSLMRIVSPTIAAELLELGIKRE